MAPGADPTSLVGEWTHSHEEDREPIQIFRPAGYEFPPARGRVSFVLRPDGTAVAGLPGPDDRGRSTDDGTWEIQGDVLQVRCPGWAATYEVVTADPTGLELRPVRQA